MIRSGRLEKIIPGYTGHIPERFKEQPVTNTTPEREGHIPGYSGYVNKIKPENLYGKTFGTITYEVQQGEAGDNQIYKTTHKTDFVDQ